jgi:hypothetical protein
MINLTSKFKFIKRTAFRSLHASNRLLGPLDEADLFGAHSTGTRANRTGE